MQDVGDRDGRVDPPTFLIGRQAGLDACEELIALSQGASAVRRLEVPLDWKLDRWPGGASLGAQSIVTWARSQAVPEFRTTRRQTSAEDFYSDLTRRLHGVAACMMAKRVYDGLTGDDVTRVANGLVEHRVEAMDALDVGTILRGQSLSLVCVDHSTRAYLKPLYHAALDEPEVRGVLDFRDLLERLVQVVSPTYHARLGDLAGDLVL